ncbi:GyrI-like domain-containing protein [bacterium]|nr:GyrI-like domain-containing protein [bacterium]MBU1985456.1 GyrI-like domain-containing protein [bacterium]
MKRWIALLTALALIGTVALAVAAEEAKTEEAAMPKCEMVGEMGVKSFPAMKVAALMVKAADYEPEGGYPEGMEGMMMAYEKMMTGGFETMGKWMEGGNHPTGPCCAAYYEDPEKTPSKDLTCKLMYPVGPDAKGMEKVMIEELPAMEAAVAQYKGPYEASGEIWKALDQWVKDNGYVPAGAPMEVYLKGPGDKVEPTEFMTEIRMPVMKMEKAEPKSDK